MDIQQLGNKELVVKYVFQFPTEHLKEQDMLLKELERRGLQKTAKDIFRQLYDKFNEIWKDTETEE